MFWIMYYILLLFFIINSAGANQQKIKFHKAETDAEKALDRILNIDSKTKSYKNKEYNDISAFIEGLERYLPMRKDRINLYKDFFSNDFIKAGHDEFDRISINEEKNIEHVKSIHSVFGKPYLDCNYIESQKANFFLYYTFFEKNKNMYIYVYPSRTLFRQNIKEENGFISSESENLNLNYLLYIMKKEDNKWKIDAMHCFYGDDDEFSINYEHQLPYK